MKNEGRESEMSALTVTLGSRQGGYGPSAGYKVTRSNRIDVGSNWIIRVRACQGPLEPGLVWIPVRTAWCKGNRGCLANDPAQGLVETTLNHMNHGGHWRRGT